MAENIWEVTFAGRPARLHEFPCLGLRVFKLFVVDKGTGLVVNELTPPGDPDQNRKDLLQLTVDWTWTP